jgi:hypothetical protein
VGHGKVQPHAVGLEVLPAMAGHLVIQQRPHHLDHLAAHRPGMRAIQAQRVEQLFAVARANAQVGSAGRHFVQAGHAARHHGRVARVGVGDPHAELNVLGRQPNRAQDHERVAVEGLVGHPGKVVAQRFGLLDQGNIVLVVLGGFRTEAEFHRSLSSPLLIGRSSRRARLGHRAA